MRTFKGIIFDVDGVIIDTENLHFLTYQDVLQKYGYKLSFEKYKEHLSGKSIKGGILSLLSETDISNGQNKDKFIQTIRDQKFSNTINLFKRKLAFFDNTIEFIRHIQHGDIELKNVGKIEKIPILAMTTGLEKTFLNEVLKKHNLKNIFTITVTPEQYIESKPDPECYETTLDKMGLNPDAVIGVEDSPAGIDALNAANIFSIGITNTHNAMELKESRLVTKTLTELLK